MHSTSSVTVLRARASRVLPRQAAPLWLTRTTESSIARGYSPQTRRGVEAARFVSRFPRCPQAHSPGRDAKCWSRARADSSAATSRSSSRAKAQRCARSSATPRAATTAGSSTPRPTRREAIEVFRGDLANPEAVRSALRGCEVVFHLGALIPIPYSYRHPREFVTANVEGTLNVLEAARAEEPSAHRPHLDERGLRDGAARPDRRGAPAAPAVAVRGDEGRRRPARALVPALVRDARRRRAAVQHLRAAPERARRDPDDRQPGALARCRRAGCDLADARLPLRRGHRRGHRRLRRRRRRRGRGDQPGHRRRDLDRRPGGAHHRARRPRGDARARRGPAAAARRARSSASSPTPRRRGACWAGSRPSSSTKVCSARSIGSRARSTSTSRRSTTSEAAPRLPLPPARLSGRRRAGASVAALRGRRSAEAPGRRLAVRGETVDRRVVDAGLDAPRLRGSSGSRRARRPRVAATTARWCEGLRPSTGAKGIVSPLVPCSRSR